MNIEKILANMEQESENVAIGHDVVNKTSDAKIFNHSALENVVIDGDGYEEYPGETQNPEHSTFDEENYNIGYDETDEDC